jgi:hypothetical protein
MRTLMSPIGEHVYYVFERNDGYVGCISSSEKLAHGQAPERLRGWTPSGCERVSFTILLQTDDWDEASTFIDEKRGVGDLAAALCSTRVPPADPIEVRRRTIDEIATRLAAVERELIRLDAEISECHGYASPAQLMIELAGECVKKAMRANGKAKS